MRKTIALFVSMAFLLGTVGFAVAQTTSAPAPTQEKKADDKSATTPKKPAKKSMTMDEKKAACLEKAGTDDAKKAKCEKQFTAKSAPKKDTTAAGAATTSEPKK